jgi:hypothetical protein
MGKVIIEQFNPRSGYWNKLYEVDEAVYNVNDPITENRYNGAYRTRFVDCNLETNDDIIEEEIEEFDEEFVEEVKKEKIYSWE